MRTTLVAAAALLFLAPPAAAVAAPASTTYPMPRPVVGDVSVHDPSLIQAKNGMYYVFSTHDGLGMRASRDLVHFTDAGPALPNGAQWATAYSGDPMELWAPDASYHNGKYWLYYAASSFGSNHSAIGLATSPTGEPGSWTDQGIVYATTTSDDFNAIDPGLFVDTDGRWWLTLGSFWSGIKMIEIDPATGKQAAWNTTLYSMAERAFPDAIEGSYIYRHGSYYYLFASFDFCCRGVNSTYRVMVGRSRTVTGPYVDQNGVAMMNGGGTQILATHGSIIGPGGQTVANVHGQDMLVYHYYDGNDNGIPKLGLNPLFWTRDGWPVVAP